jgi:hypothetical protein
MISVDELKNSKSLKRDLERFGLKEIVDPYVKYRDECKSENKSFFQKSPLFLIIDFVARFVVLFACETMKNWRTCFDNAQIRNTCSWFVCRRSATR